MKLMKYRINKEKLPFGKKTKAAVADKPERATVETEDPFVATPPESDIEQVSVNEQVRENAVTPATHQELEVETGDADVEAVMESPQDNNAETAEQPAAPASDSKEPESKEKGVFASLFDEIEEKEETPIDRLIKVLPDVSTHELLDELQEVNMIIEDWQQL